ncbi:MAG: CHAT domain-containing protein [Cyanobacteria bacterium P01_D01_bin.105]
MTGTWPSNLSDYLLNHVGMGIVILEIAIAGAYVASRVLAKDERFELIQNIATTLTTLGGTTFHCANLTEANCTLTRLKCTDLSKATLKRTNFYNAQQLDTSKLNGTILESTPVRRLAVSKNGHQQNYQNLNLQGINLTDAELSNANFTESNLNEATLVRAVLLAANLTKVQSIGTDFQRAQLTGACIEAWNINNSTQLTDIDCQYLYLRNHQQERRPSSGFFEPGEFAQLFQEVIDTIDLLFQNGVNWQALNTMLAQANQTQPQTQEIQSSQLSQSLSPNPMVDQNQPFSIRSIENKNDGAVVVRIDAPPNADKADIHQKLVEAYNNALQTIEASYQKQIQAKDEQIESYRQQQAIFNQVLLNQNATQAQNPADRHIPTKLIHFKLTTHTHNRHHLINLQIGEEGKLPFLDTTATLPSSQDVIDHYQKWQASYRQHLMAVSRPIRIQAPKNQLTNINIGQLRSELRALTQQLHHAFNGWLTDESVRPLREKLLENLNPNDSIRIVLQTDNPQLWQLPWNCWEILERYPRSELTISTQHYQYRDFPTETQRPLSNNKINILAVLGSSEDLDIQVDCNILQNLPHSQLTTLTQPSRQTLNNQLWDTPYDILFFAGHSTSEGGQGILRLNATDSLTLNELKYALQRACQQGLQLAIFNSCDGLGLIHALSDLSLQHLIVMREAVPDQVAQVFLENLLTAFARGLSLPQSVREAREKLQCLENRFPCATWLPALCQTAATPPLTWQALKND